MVRYSAVARRTSVAASSQEPRPSVARRWLDLGNRVHDYFVGRIHNTGTDPIYAATLAAKENIIIYTVTFSNEADMATMQEIASIGTGKHIHAVTGADLMRAFQEIAKSLPTLITY